MSGYWYNGVTFRIRCPYCAGDSIAPDYPEFARKHFCVQGWHCWTCNLPFKVGMCVAGRTITYVLADKTFPSEEWAFPEPEVPVP